MAQRQMATPDWDLEVHLESLITSYSHYSKRNIETMERSARKRRKGLYLLLASVMGYVIATSFIVGGAL